MNMKKLFSLASSFLLCASVVLAGCSSSGGNTQSGGASSSTTGGDSNEIVIGVTNPLTGPLAEMGQDIHNGIKLAVELKNEAGGINGKQIKLVEADVPDPTAAKTEAERLINKEGAEVIIGTYGSSISIAVSEVTARLGIPYFEIVSLANTITDRGYDNVYRFNPYADKFAEVAKDSIINVIAPKLGKNVNDLRIALIHEDTDNGQSWMDAFERIMENENLKDTILMRESYSAGTSDMSSLILKLKDAQPDIVVAVSYLNDAVLFVRQSKELGVDYPVLLGGGAGWGQPGLAEALGSMTDGIMDIEYPPLPPYSNAEAMPGIEEYMVKYEEKFGEKPDGVYSHVSYAAANDVFEIIEKAGSTDPEKMKEAVYSMNKDWWTTASGWGVKFADEGGFVGQNMNSAPFLTQWKDGQLYTVAPEEISAMEPMIPKPRW